MQKKKKTNTNHGTVKVRKDLQDLRVQRLAKYHLAK